MSDTRKNAHKHTPKMRLLTLTPRGVLTRHGDVWHNRASIHVHTHSSIPCHKTLPERSCQESISEWWWQGSVLTPDSSIPPTVEHSNCVCLRDSKAHFFCLLQIWWPYTSGNRDGDCSLRIGLEKRLSPHTHKRPDSDLRSGTREQSLF